MDSSPTLPRTDSATSRLASFAAATRDAPPPRIIADSLARLKDTLGISLAAYREAPVTAIRNLAVSWGGNATSSLLGNDMKLPVPAAALVNGTMAHALDFDDTHVPSILHPSASVVPAALAASEDAGASGTQLLAAIAVGNEIAIRLGMAAHDETLNNNIFFDKGLHATSVCGALGAAAAAALAYRLPAAAIQNAMGIAASMGSGIIEANRNGGSVKRVHCGWAAHAGVIAAQMARHGITAPATALEGRFGFFNAYLGINPDPEIYLNGLGLQWELHRCFPKPYPTNVFTHTGIDAARNLAAQGVKPGDIARVELSVPEAVMRTISEPREKKISPPTGYSAQFSGPYTFAMALKGGGGLGVFLDDFTDEILEDEEVRQLASHVYYVPDQACEDVYPDHFPTIARVRLNNGTVIEERIMTNLGTIERPLSDAEVDLKFQLTAGRLGRNVALELEHRLELLPSMEDSRLLLNGMNWATA